MIGESEPVRELRLAEQAHRALPGQADETIFLIRRSHPETNRCSIRSLREESYDRAHRGSRCLVQHQHLRGSSPRRVSDALMGMDRSTLPSADPSTVWLADLIEATEVVAASAEPCDPRHSEGVQPSSGVAHRCQAPVRTGRLGARAN